MTAAERRREALTVFIILTAALLVRVGMSGVERVIRYDEPDYLTLGINLFSARGYTTGVAPELHYTPLFPIVSGLVYLLVGNAELASNIVYIVTGALLIVPVYALARRLYSRQVATVAALLLTVYPPLTAAVLFWGTMTEPLYMLLVYCAVYSTLVALEDNRLWACAAAGVLLSLAYLTRPEGLITFLMIFAFVVLVRLVQRRLLTRATVMQLVLFALAFALVAAPYLGWLYAKSGRLLITGKLGLTYAMGQAVLNKDPAEYDRLIASLDSTGTEIVWYSPERFSYSVLADFLADPPAFGRRIVANARILAGQLFAHTIFSTILLIPLLVGLMDRAWTRDRLRREAFLATIVAAPLVAFLPFHIEIRFFAPLLPVLIIWAGHGLLHMGRWLVGTWQQAGPQAAALQERGHLYPILAALPVLVVLAFFVVLTPGAVSAGQRSVDWTHKDAGLWLEKQTPPGSVIMTRDLSIAVYARRPWIPSPNASLDQVLAYARRHKADYYVIDEHEITTLRPQLVMLLNTDNPPPGLMHSETFQDGKRRTIIYRIEP